MGNEIRQNTSNNHARNAAVSTVAKRQDAATPNGCFQDTLTGNVYGVAMSGLPESTGGTSFGAGNSTGDSNVDFWMLSNTFLSLGASQCAPRIEASRIELPATCAPMSNLKACQGNIGYFLPDNQKLANSDAFFQCMVTAGADLVVLPEDKQANDACPTSFPGVQQFSNVPSLNPSNGVPSVDPNGSSSPHGVSGGVIAGAVIVAVGATALIVAGGLYLLRKHRGGAPAAAGAPRGILPLRLVNDVLGGRDAAAVQGVAGDAPNFIRTARPERPSRSNADGTQSLHRSRSARIPVRPSSIAEATVAGHEDLEQGFELQQVFPRDMV